MNKNQVLASKSMMSRYKKYGSLIILVLLFLALTVGLLVLNFVSTERLAKFTQVLTISNQQGSVVQQLSKNLMDINLYIEEYTKNKNTNPTTATAVAAAAATITEATDDQTIPLEALPQSALYRLEEIKHQQNLFSQALAAFQKGGEAQTLDGNKFAINSVMDNQVAQASLKTTQDIWTPYVGLLNNFIEESQKGVLKKQTSEYLVNYTRLYNQSLQTESNILSQALNKDINRYADLIKLIQLAGIGFAFLLFVMIVFGALRQLTKADAQLDEARQETEEIMATINEGLFLVAPDLTIGSQYSAQLENIIGQRDLGGKNFTDVLAQFVPKEDLDITQTFIEQLYSDWVVEDLIEDLNPLHRIRADVDDLHGGLATKYLDFKFSRVYRGDKIERVLVSVSDTSQSVLLQRNLEEQREQSNREIEMLSTVINADPAILHDFIAGSQQRIQVINETLKRPEQNQQAMQEKARYIAREIHSLKGESSAMNLHRMVNTCEVFEDDLRQLRKKSTLTGQDFIGLAVLLEDLYKLTDVLAGYSKRVGNSFNRPAAKQDQGASTQPGGSREQYFRNFATDIANRNHKQIQMSCVGLDDGILSTAQQNSIKDIAIQLLRNAIVHGIETPEIRRQRGKAPQGKLSLSLSRNTDNTVTLIAEDDGNGINFDAIRLKAAASGQCSAAEANNLTKQQLLALMFSSGFSTADHTSEDAGKGVGMDIIKTTVQELGGKLKVSSSPEEYTRFSIVLPQAAKNQ